MTQPTPAPLSTPPLWSHCAQGAGPQDLVGCPGIRVPGHTACLTHLVDTDRNAYLTGLAPGSNINHSGTTFTPVLLSDLLNAVHDPVIGRPRFGSAGFSAATFEGDASFRAATFEGDTDFRVATFKGDTDFTAATFERPAEFGSATFEGDAEFGSVTFKDAVGFHTAIFESDVTFLSATFERAASLLWATFMGDAVFLAATFARGAAFTSATFKSSPVFASATFKGPARFGSAAFERGAAFRAATFEGPTSFSATIFKGDTDFVAVAFERGVNFESAAFEGDIDFGSATFERAASLGPLVCAGRVVLSGAVFGRPVTLSFAARQLECRRTRWSSTAEIRLRYTRVDFAQAVFEYPLTIAAEVDPFLNPGGQQMAETLFATEPDATVRVASLRGVDAAHLVLSDVDLSECLFTGTVHLDQVRLEGACAFAAVPPGRHWRGGLPVRFTQRRTLAEEHHWRAGQPAAVPGWNASASGAGRAGPVQLAPVYRALRKAFEDGKHEPGAADFYYGEMEMRRHADDIPRGERSLLTAYWAMSGYGLRASRALGWLVACMLATVVLMMGFGLPQDDPKQRATGTVPAGGGKVSFEIDKPDPQNPIGNRFTGKRFEKALRVTLNSVVFRSSGQDLTTAGTYIEMTSRLTEPVLLGLAILAVRNRVKR
ncbi:pentapeptide repeat-containing protein [Streptomyces sp. NPDC001523]|uniref:pentapeptide repeat-containing protein n=1 Tax=Streptomyces sp. NPDC001523 TaxID=3154383 RepID=UPI00332E35C2